MFKKISHGANKFFKKAVHDTSMFSKTVGNIAGKLDKGIATVAKVGGAIASSPLGAAVIATNPELAPLVAGAAAATQFAKTGAKGLHQVSSLTNPSNYKPITGVPAPAAASAAMDNAQSGIQRAKDLASTGQQLVSFVH